MTRVATLHQQRPGGVGDTSPARGRPVAHIPLCLCCVCVFSGNFLRAAQLVGVLLGLERFSYGRGRSGSLMPCPPSLSTLTSCLACTVRLNMRASAHMHCRSCHPIITTMSTALPTCHLRCMSNKLILRTIFRKNRHAGYMKCA